MKCSHAISAEAQAKLDANDAYFHATEHEIINGLAAQEAELAANRMPNESDIASMPAGFKFPVRLGEAARKAKKHPERVML